MRLKTIIRSGASAIVLASLAGGVAYAQEDEATTVSGLVVTVQKREQQLQDVPASVTVANEQVLEAAGVRDIKDLTILTPGLLVTSTSNETVTTARIRGVGTVGDNPGLESSVSVVIDGVYRPRNGVGFGDLGEMQRIEVLKGPQGTLFGKNTSAGVINVITQEPRFDFRAIGEAQVGNYGYMNLNGTVTGPLVEDQLAGRLYLGHTERDGFYDVNVVGPRTLTEDATQDYTTARGQLLWFPNDNTTLRVIADYTERDEFCCLGVQIARGALNGAVQFLTANEGLPSGTNLTPFDRIAHANRDTNQQIEDSGLSFQADIDTGLFGGSTLTSITAARSWETTNAQDSDFSGADLLYRPVGIFGREFDQFSQELRLNGESMDGRLNWLVGGFFADEDLHSDEGLRNGDDLEDFINVVFAAAGGLQTFTGVPNGSNIPQGSGYQDTYDQTARTWALFTQNSYQATERLEVTFGLRYTQEDKELNTQYRNVGGSNVCANLLAREPINAGIFGSPPGQLNPFSPTNQAAGRTTTSYALLYGYMCAAGATPAFNSVDTVQTRDEDQVTGTIKLAYRFNPELMTYFSFSRGYKGGGFNLDRARTGNTVAGFGVQSDTSFAPEIADSFELGVRSNFGDNLLLNATAFYQKYEGFQLNTFTGISFIVASIPTVTAQGVDLDFLWFTPIDGLDVQGGVVYSDTQFGNFATGPGISPLLPRNRLPFAPLWSVSNSVSYERPFGNNMLFRGSLNARYTSAYNTGSDLNPLKEQGAYTLVNARLGIGAADENWMVEAWAQNLTDTEYYQVAFDSTFQAGSLSAFLGAPGTYGITLRKRLGN